MVISQLEFSGNVGVVSGDSCKILLKLNLQLAEVVVDGGEFSDLLCKSSHLEFIILNNLDGVVVVKSDRLEFSFNLSKSLNGNVILLKRSCKLFVDIIISSSQFHDLLSLDLASVLKLAVGLVRSIKRHFKFSDGDGHLLLNSFNFNLKSGFRFSKFTGKNINFNNKFLLHNFKFLSGTTKLLFKFSLHLSKFLLKKSNTIKGLLFAGISILVSTGKLLTFMSKFAVITVHISHAFLESIKLHLQSLAFIIKNTLVTGKSFIAHLDNISSTSLVVLISPLIQVGHLLQLGGKISAILLTNLELGSNILDDNLAMFKVLNQNIDFGGELSLSVFSSLQHLLKLVAIISEAVNFQGNLLLHCINFFNTKASFTFILLLPVTIFLLPLLNRSLKIDLN